MTWKEELEEMAFSQPRKLWLDDTETFITSLLKKQRVECGQKYFRHADENDSVKLRDYIFNAPEPKE